MADEPFDLGLLGGHRALDLLVDEILGAGEEAMRLYRSGAADRARMKQDNSPVTEADEAVEHRLREFVRKQFPDAGFLGEETGAAGPEGSGTRFIVDPIDGTRAFIRGLPTWSILVGIEHAGEPVVGVALMPAAGDLFVGVCGAGSHANGRPVRLSTVAALAQATVSHGGLAQFTGAEVADALPKLAEGTFTQRGFADFDGYRQLLLGRVDAMVDPGTTPWDLCAAAALTRAAGGRFTSLGGEESIYGGGGLASNGLVHDALVALLR